jgi:hypothetical protein
MELLGKYIKILFMKKAIILGAIIFSLSANGQQMGEHLLSDNTKRITQSKIIDTTVQITLSLNEYRAIMSVIDSNIDSKKTTKELIDFLNSKLQIVTDKPKEIIKK